MAVQPTTEFGNFWSSGAHLTFRAQGPATFQATLPTYPSDAGNYNVDWWYTAGPDYGRCELWFNGEKACEWDGFNEGGTARKKVEKVTPITVKPTGNVLELRIVGKNSASTGFNAGLDCYRVLPR